MVAANTTSQKQVIGAVHSGITRPTAASVVLPHAQPTEEVRKLRIAWAQLLDTNQPDEAHRLLSEINSAETLEQAIDAGIAELCLIERRAVEARNRKQAATQKPQAAQPATHKPQPKRQAITVRHPGKTAKDRLNGAAARNRHNKEERAAKHKKGSDNGKK